MKRAYHKWILLLVLSLPQWLPAQYFQAIGAPAEPKVTVSWNRYYDYKGITDICQQLAEAHPNLCRLSSIGKSYEGRELWALTLTNYKIGKPEDKPGYYIDGNIHSNEIQGTEVGLYTAWYLVENFGQVDQITDLLNRKTFYIVPTINPDARENYMRSPNSPHSPRSGMLPVDDDGDGYVDEDGFDDLDQDGHITQMRRKRIGGRFKTAPEDSRRMIPAGPDEQGTYELLGSEGLDNDGDGKVNEDKAGFYDPNRDWAWNWQPSYIQGGAYKYPFSIPENEAVRRFVMERPNIAGAQSYHNAGGMILRGPGSKSDKATYPPQDKKVYDIIAKKGAEVLPGYHDWILYKDLYTVYGGEIEFFHGGLGIFSFTNELWTPYYMFNKKNDAWFDSSEESFKFDRELLFGAGFVDWKPFDHPQYGAIEIGGFKKNFTRANPSFLLEQDAHRNMAFTLYHAWHMPQLEIGEIQSRKLSGNLWEVKVEVRNLRLIPTHSGHDMNHKITPPDLISLEGAEVVSGMVMENADLNLAQEQVYEPAQLRVANIPGFGKVSLRWIVKGKGPYTVRVDSRKGGKHERKSN